MEGGNWEISSFSDDEVGLVDGDEEELHYGCGSVSKLQFRIESSKGRWVERLQVAEVVVKKGKMWTTTAIIRGGKTYCLIEEAVYLCEIGALQLVNEDGTPITLEHMYKKFTDGRSSFRYEYFEVYRHLKSLGYVVGRHGVPWSLKAADIDLISKPLRDDSAKEGKKDIEGLIIEELRLMAIDEVRPVFDVYLPNSKFKKSSPGTPSFVACLTRGRPPSMADVVALGGRLNAPAKFCHLEHGRVSWFSFEMVELPVLP